MKKGNIILIIFAVIIITLLIFVAFYLWQISEQLIQVQNTLTNIKSDVYWIKFH